MSKIILTDGEDNGFSEPVEQRAEGEGNGVEVQKKYSLIDPRWEPETDREMNDFEVCALVNRDCGRYANAGLAIDDPMLIESYIDKQLEEYKSRLSVMQAEFYRMSFNQNMFAFLIQWAQQRRQMMDRDRGAVNQIMQEMNKPGKRGRH